MQSLTLELLQVLGNLGTSVRKKPYHRPNAVSQDLGFLSISGPPFPAARQLPPGKEFHNKQNQLKFLKFKDHRLQ